MAIAFTWSINYWAVLVSAVLSMVLGFVWYSQSVFGKAWIRMMNISSADMKKAKKDSNMGLTYFFSFLGNLVMILIFAAFLNLLQTVDMSSAIALAFLVWVGFMATTMIGMVLFEKKPFSLFLINSGYNLATLILSAIVLTLWM